MHRGRVRRVRAGPSRCCCNAVTSSSKAPRKAGAAGRPPAANARSDTRRVATRGAVARNGIADYGTAYNATATPYHGCMIMNVNVHYL